MAHAARIAGEDTPAASQTDPRASCWPTELEFLLLQAGLLGEPKATEAWNQFCRSVEDIEKLDDGCYRLFPLVAANLPAADGNLPHLSRINGVLRHSWAKNQRLLTRIIPGLRSLQTAGIEFLLLKGAALSQAYREWGSVRPMEDVDILIRPHDLKSAVALLSEAGFRPEREVTVEHLSDLLRFRHELTVRAQDGSTLDVHWYLVSDSTDVVAEDRFWEDAVDCQLSDFTGRALNASDQFLHTCLHGVQWNEVSPVRWLADATILIGRGVDWPRVEEQARCLRQIGPVRETVLFLDSLGVELPPPLVLHWQNIKLTSIEELENGFRTRRPERHERTRQLAWVYLRISRKMTFWEMVRNLPAFMRQVHHFRAYSRCIRFLAYLGFLVGTGKRHAL